MHNLMVKLHNYSKQKQIKRNVKFCHFRLFINYVVLFFSFLLHHLTFWYILFLFSHTPEFSSYFLFSYLMKLYKIICKGKWYHFIWCEFRDDFCAVDTIKSKEMKLFMVSRLFNSYILYRQGQVSFWSARWVGPYKILFLFSLVSIPSSMLSLAKLWIQLWNWYESNMNGKYCRVLSSLFKTKSAHVSERS